MGSSKRKPGGQRLTQKDWIRAGLDGLVKEGSRGLRIARLARALGVTPGSFYWHFQDRAQFRDKLLAYWMNRMISDAGERAKRSGRGSSPIRALGPILARQGLPRLDAAMRSWAVSDPAVASAVTKADGLRVRRVAAMFGEAGFDEAAALERARMLLWIHVGSIGADERDRQRVMQSLLETLLRDPVRERRRRDRA